VNQNNVFSKTNSNLKSASSTIQEYYKSLHEDGTQLSLVTFSQPCQ